MSIETRHWAWCSLGPLAPSTPATISDGYVQGSGIVATRGTITLAGIYRPVVGTPVSLAYSNGQSWIARVPRRLRVLSSLADPLRGITTVSVGCLLTLYANRKPPAQALTEAEENASVPEVVRRSAALPITAAWVTQKILTALGLTAAGAIPFTIARVVDEWDMTAGYVEELGRIAQSEGYFCWMNEAEQVAFISKDQELSTGPLITRGQIIDLQPVNVGDLPGDAVFSNYTSLKLNPPENLTDEDRSQRNWEREVVIGGGVQSIHSYTNSQGQTVKEFITYNDASVTETIYDGGDRVIRREERSNQLNGVRVSKTRFQYASGFVNRESEDYSRVLKEITEEFTPEGDIAAACGLDAPHAQFLRGNRLTSWRVTEYDRESSSGVTLTKTTAASAYLNTPFGADAIAKLREAGEPLQDLIGQASRLVPFGSSVRIRTEREFGLQRRPSQQERNQAALSKAPAVEQTTTAAWLLGSAASETAVELSPPYVSDDVIVATGSPPTYSVVPAPASQQALNYGRIENRLLLANRNGVGLQLAPLDMPAAPFGLFYLRLNGSTAALRTNGTTWTIGENGIVCSTDALFWGAIDGNPSTAWFPLPPGQSTLPAAVAVTTNASPTPANAMAIPGGFNPLAPDLSALFAALPTGTAAVPRQSVNPSIIVRPWREVITLRAGLRVGAKLTERPWIPQTIQLGGGVRVGASLTRITVVAPPAAAPVVVQGLAPGVSIGARVLVPAAGVAVSALAPTVTNSVVVAVPAAVVAVAALPPDQVGTPKTVVSVPAASVAVAGLAPEVVSGALVAVPAAGVVVAGLAPSVATSVSDPNFSSVSLLLHMDGANGSTTVLDSSPSPSTVTVFTDAVLSTADSKFGGASAFFDGTDAYMTTPANANMRFGSGDFTIEGWFKRKGSCPTSSIICSAYDGTSFVNFAISMGDTGSTHLLRAGFFNNGWNWIIDSTETPLDEWIFFAYVRRGNLLSFYKNENLIGTLSFSGSLPSANMETRIGRGWDSQRFFNGYIDEIRATKGVGRYETGTGANANKMVFAGTNTLALPAGPFPDS